MQGDRAAKFSARASDAVQKFIGSMQSNSFPEILARTIIHRQADVPSAKWSLGNRLIMMFEGTDDARGIKQWNEVGRKVKKGARAFYIWAPRMKKKVVEEIDVTTGETEEVERLVLVGFISVPVFRYEDTEGEPIPRSDYSPTVLPPLYEIADKLGLSVRYAPQTGALLGYYDPGRSEIILMSHDEDVFFHELAHAIDSRIPNRPKDKATREIVAEMSAAALCIMYGYNGRIREAARYVKEFAERAARRPEKALQHILSCVGRVEQVVTYILDLADGAAPGTAQGAVRGAAQEEGGSAA